MLGHRLRMLQGRGTAAIFDTPGDFDFLVPLGVTSISMLCLGAGGNSEVTTNVPIGNGAGGGGGGGLSYSNSLAVTPGETLNIHVGYPVGSALRDSSVNRGGGSLVYASGGSAGVLTAAGSGGSVSGAIGAVKYAGGAGAAGSTTAARGGGGGSSATTAASGAAAVLATIDERGGGRGASLSVTPTQDAYTVNSSFSASLSLLPMDSMGAGGGGGGGARVDGSSPAFRGDGGDGLVILLWGGRVFSSSTSF